MDEQAVEKKTRIFVGGLGEHVSRDDLLKLFSSLGKAENLEIIRTKGRSIAYVDFSPSSSKSLPKLFSIYNGCVWKGGKLRIDKAKEHYLIRLKQEWEDDARLASEKTHAEEGGLVMEEPTKVAIVEKGKPGKKISNAEKAQIRLFFPKLRKVKALPFSGTGKHKYSFQRIEVPSMPVHFCDCEEHSVSVPFHTGNVDHILNVESQNGGMTEEEFNMMNSVLNKLFEAHNIQKVVPDPVVDGDHLVESTDGPLPSSDHSENDDDDDLIINIGSNRRNKVSVPEWIKDESVLPNQDMRDQPWTSNDEQIPSTLPSQTKKVATFSPNKKRKLIGGKEYDENNSGSSIPKERKNLQTNLPKLEEPLETFQTGSELGEQQLKGRSWSQKSSWKNLVGDGASSLFSVSDVLVDNTSVKKRQKKSCNEDLVSTVDKQTQNSGLNEQLSEQLVRGKNLEGFEVDELAKSNGVQKSVSDVREQQKSSSTPSFVGRSEEPVHSEDVQDQTSKSNELELCEKSQAVEPNEINKSRGASWYQKSSWTQLVGGTNDSSFSISDIVPSVTFVNQVAPKSKSISLNSGGVGQCAASNHGISVSPVDSARPIDNVEGSMNAPKTSVTGVLHAEQTLLNSLVHQNTSENNTGNTRSTIEVSAPSTGKKEKAPQKSIADIMANETCSFMCSAASMKEWANAKAALSGSRKRKTVEKETH